MSLLCSGSNESPVGIILLMTLLCHTRSPSLCVCVCEHNKSRKGIKVHIKSSTLLVYTATSDLCRGRSSS